ncbi:MAG TPA: hypothetical protein VK550_18975 [Polyangiaceae bacterium]|nr:hypothetical protein [Polyangiaceae bacterium]
MKLGVARWLCLAAAGGSALLAGAGCADSESILFVRQAQARIASGANGCTVDSSPSSLFITEGTLDLAFRTEYRAALLVGNQLVARGNSSQLRTETSRVEVQGAVVRLEDGTSTVWGPFTVPGSGFIDPATGSTPSYGLTEAILLGSAFGNALAGDLTQRSRVRRFTSIVKILGKTLGGTAVESGEWRFPLTVCYGCLVSFPPEASDSKAGRQPNCDLAAGTGTAVAAPCALGQDDAVDCRVCKAAIRQQDAWVCQPSP